MFKVDSEVSIELRANWHILAIAFSCLFFGVSAPTYAMPFLYPEVIKEFGWTREQATLLASAKFATGAVVALAVGSLIDRIGVWIALIITLAVGGVAMVSFLWIPDLTSYYIAGLLLGFTPPGAIVAVKVLISRTFHSAQGIAMGITLLGAAAGSVVLPVITSALIIHSGWRAAFAVLSAGIWLMLPVLLLAMSSVSLGKKGRAEQQEVDNVIASKQVALWEILQTRNFWLLAISVFLISAVDQAFVQHQVLIFQDLSFSPHDAALKISLIGLIGFVTRVIVGFILDKSSNKGMAALYFSTTLACLTAIYIVNPIVLVIYILFRATSNSVVLMDTAVMTKHIFGMRNIGALLGIYTAIVSAGFAIGPWVMGRLYDSSGSYASSFIVGASLPLIGAVMMWYIKPVFWLSLRGGVITIAK